jgi:hypothetical protein
LDLNRNGKELTNRILSVTKRNKSVIELYNISSLPANILIDRKGIVVARNVSLSDLENEIVKLLK